MTKRFLTLLLVLCLIFCTACGTGDLPDLGSTYGGTQTSEPITDTATEPATEPVTDPADPEPIGISIMDYRLILAQDVSDTLYDAILSFEEEMASYEIDLRSDTDLRVPEHAYAKEIVVGNAAREGVQDALLELSEGDYLIRYLPQSGRILILGSDDAATLRALQGFRAALSIDARDVIWELPASNTLHVPADRVIRTVTVSGVDLCAYRVVIPQNADAYTQAAAQNISDFFQNYYASALEIVNDSVPAQTHEILLGRTNRSESAHSLTLGAGEYLLFAKNGKIVMQGEGWMVGGAFGAFVQRYIDLTAVNAVIAVDDLPTEPRAEAFVFPQEVRNVILMIGDGMGYGQIAMAEQNGLEHFAAASLPYVGEAITRSQSVINGSSSFTDSAAAATALATGRKTLDGYVGVLPNNATVQNVRELAQSRGAKTAVVTTDAITGATPAGFLCHWNNRNATAELQKQINALIAAELVDYCKGDVGDQLTAHTRAALLEISDSASPFFLMVEEAYIDKNCHNASMSSTYAAVVRFHNAIIYAMEFVLCHPGTALIVTGDHETGGIVQAGSIGDMSGVVAAKYLDAHRSKIQGDITKYGFSFTAFNSTSSASCNHTNANIPIFAVGAGTQSFHGKTVENTEIANYIAAVFGGWS